MSAPDDDEVHECAARRCARDIGHGAQCPEATVALPEVAWGSGDAMSQLLAQYPEPAPKRVLTATEEIRIAIKKKEAQERKKSKEDNQAKYAKIAAEDRRISADVPAALAALATQSHFDNPEGHDVVDQEIEQPMNVAASSQTAQSTETPGESEKMHILRTEPYDFLQGWGMWPTNVRHYHTPVTHEANTLSHSFKEAPANLKQCKWMRVLYDAPLELVATTLTAKLPMVLIDATSVRTAGTTADATHVFIYKSSQHNIRESLASGNHVPTAIEVAIIGRAIGKCQAKFAQKELLTRFQELPGKHITNMFLGKTNDVEEHTAKTLFDAVKHMTDENYEKFVLDARLKKENDTDSVNVLEGHLCNSAIESRVKILRKISNYSSTNVIYANRIKETGQVQKITAFKSTWNKLLVTIHDRSLLTPFMPRRDGNKVTLQTFLDYKELHQNVTLFIPGNSRTGKTELAKVICLVLAMKYQKEDPLFIMANTLDSLRGNQSLMLPGVPVLLDDIGGDGGEDQQLIYSSTSIWKAILQIRDATQCRARNDDIMWASRQPKVLTTNCTNIEEWIGVMLPRAKGNHKDAIILRTAEMETIKESLYSSTSAPSGSGTYLLHVMDTESIFDSIQGLYD